MQNGRKRSEWARSCEGNLNKKEKVEVTV